MVMTQFLTNVLVLTSSLFEALYTTSTILVFLAIPSEAQLKFPSFNLNALYFMLPPLTLKGRIRCSPNLVLAGTRPNSNCLFF